MNNSKSNVARAQLVQKSVKAKKKRECLIAEAKSLIEANHYASLPINEFILSEYKKESGAKVFKTFKKWKDEGFRVKKGEKAFRVWSAPIKGKKEIEAKSLKTKDNETIEQTFEFWGMCCLFNEFQVEREGEGDNFEKSENKENQNISSPSSNDGNDTTGASSKLKDIARKLTSEIDHCFRERLTNTPKRIAQANTARAHGERLKRTQEVALALANLHDRGEVPDVLEKIKTKKAIFELVDSKKEFVSNGFHSYYIDTGKQNIISEQANAVWSLLSAKSEEEVKRDRLQRKIESLQLSQIHGYFPTQGQALRSLIQRADIQIGHCVADTSAGSGHILDFISETFQVSIEAFEINPSLREILGEKGYSNVGDDFLAVFPEPKYDRVVINPPFENLQDIEHVKHSFEFLNPGGKLVAIMSASAFFRGDQKCKGFRTWFTSLGGIVENLPEGSFKESGTMVSTKLITIDKPLDGLENEENPFVCEDYEAKQAAREQRYLDSANRASEKSHKCFSEARKLGDVIPFGQPILKGHHSEGKDRRFRDRICKKYDKAMILSDRADHYCDKAASVGKGGIASDDPKAIEKLKTKLLECEQKQDLMKKANRLIKKSDKEGLISLGFNEAEVGKLFEPDFAGRVGFADYQLKNNNAEIRRLKERIKGLTELRRLEPLNHEHDEFKVFLSDGRIHVEFLGGKPPEHIREQLKLNSFKFSRFSATWVRKVTSSAIFNTHRLIKTLENLYSQL